VNEQKIRCYGQELGIQINFLAEGGGECEKLDFYSPEEEVMQDSYGFVANKQWAEEKVKRLKKYLEEGDWENFLGCTNHVKAICGWPVCNGCYDEAVWKLERGIWPTRKAKVFLKKNGKGPLYDGSGNLFDVTPNQTHVYTFLGSSYSLK